MFQAAAIVAGVALVTLALARYTYLALVVFAAILFAVLLDAAARLVRRPLPLGRKLAVGGVAVLGLGVVVLVGWWAGPRLSEQTDALIERLPDSLNRLEDFLYVDTKLGEALLPAGPDGNGWSQERLLEALRGTWSSVAGMFATAFSALSGVVVVAFLGFFLAFEPAPYVRGLLHLVPPRGRERGREVLDAVGHALRWWFVGRLASMAIVGVLTAIGLALLGVPLAILLGLIAGALAFVPYLGPVFSALPAVLLGLAESPRLALYVALLYLGIQVVESNLVTPLIQARTVALLPAVLITAQLVLGGLFGILGVLVASPLTATAIVLVQLLYVQDQLGDDVGSLGDHGGS